MYKSSYCILFQKPFNIWHILYVDETFNLESPSTVLPFILIAAFDTAAVSGNSRLHHYYGVSTNYQVYVAPTASVYHEYLITDHALIYPLCAIHQPPNPKYISVYKVN